MYKKLVLLFCMFFIFSINTSVAFAAKDTKDYTMVYNVKDNNYGAKGDGTTDDTAAIQSVLNAVYANGGGIVYFPEGTYKTSDNLYVYSNTTVRGNQSAKIEKIDTNNGYAVLKIADDASNVVIEQITMQNNRSGGCIDIEFGQGANKVWINGVTFYGKRAQGVSINQKGVKNVNINNCHFEELTYGVLTNANATDVEDVRIINNQFIHIYGDAVELNHPGTAYTAGHNFVISGNYMNVPSGYGTGGTAGFAIGIAGADYVTISNNVMENVRYEAIHIEDEAKHISITGNTIDGVFDSPGNNLNSGIYVIDGDYITISGNNVRNAQNYGIHCEMAANADAKQVSIVCNIVTNCGTGGILMDSYKGDSDYIISDNICSSNTGNGITLGLNLNNVKVTNNICRDNTGYGLYEQKEVYNLFISGNSFINNTAGDIGFSSKVNFPMPLRDNTTSFTTVPASNNYTPWTNAFRLGKGASGILYVTASKPGAHSTEIYSVTWNGTTLTSTLIASDNYGTIDVNPPQMNGDSVQVRCYTLSKDTVSFDVQFEGIILLR